MDINAGSVFRFLIDPNMLCSCTPFAWALLYVEKVGFKYPGIVSYPVRP